MPANVWGLIQVFIPLTFQKRYHNRAQPNLCSVEVVLGLWLRF